VNKAFKRCAVCRRFWYWRLLQRHYVVYNKTTDQLRTKS